MRVENVLEKLSDIILEKSDKLILSKELNSVTDNSENINKNDVFVAIKGYKFDGHNFIKPAIKKGCSLVIIENKSYISDLDFPYILVSDSRVALARLSHLSNEIDSNEFKIFGVTGTNGKSTSVNILHHLLRESKISSSLLSTVEIKINDLLIEEPYNTTPSIIKISNLLKQSKDKDVNFINLEVSSHAISQKRIEDIYFDIISFTNITRDHLDYHSSFNEYEKIKLSLANNLKPDGKVIINYDNFDMKKFEFIDSKKIITYGFSDDADYVIKELNQSIYQMNFKLITPDEGEISIYSSIIGSFNAYNIVNSLIAARQFGLSYEQIKHGIITFKGVRGRFEIIPSSKALGFSVVIDFAHTPDALENVLKNARSLTEGRIIVVFGAGGNADKGKRKIMGQIASELSDIVVITNDDPKDEDPDKIIEQVKEGVNKEKNFIVIPDRKTAINAAINFANREDIVIIAGRGHEKFQLFGGGKQIKFSDYDVAAEAIDGLRRSMKK
ncbi:UDP-N-acetylmuramoyl-L-alanyl-D-glutamate--2,6-diaminopimelate ligase [Oceanotoga sp. DSM 15011]|uniref:UDP-N-acetylmuramoyl-L-alanyl-D-glutamate--2, 6-diaminopimelate ligase n=1 Tax=Oceanotoga sp. DSM 15011 TaxID=2984951 RepID=UPI0021F45CF2|nr:UDP-N-acetylmuramoyl-L-alanyl-D-glutamate--2,6-diaminopimelate ligase [Oceanotoga sp. DSM 15011]UYP01084.1 UDP-N-acetylmuramoyl-L-alanyl-D-glutamate--2,6-diaminopimelate ligase [Oceanotoga sp. DSM 15011]